MVHRVLGRKKKHQIKKQNVGKFDYGSYEKTNSKKSAESNFIPGTGAKKIPVLLQHGLGSASDSWVLQGPTKDLAYLLSDEGYDVWLGNCRGNYYSRSHKTYSPDGHRFWNFSFHEMGYYDLPAVIDHILNVTKAEKLYYIGHSMGTTMFFVMASTRPEYNEKIRLFTALAPVTTIQKRHMKLDKKLTFESAKLFLNMNRLVGNQEIFPRKEPSSLDPCKNGIIVPKFCFRLTHFWAGIKSDNVSTKTMKLIMSHIPAGFSLKTATHFIQNMESELFRQYDYGPHTNFEIYGSKNPPVYNLTKITCPVSIHYSTGDLLTDDKDVTGLIKQLRTVENVQRLDEFNHIDFIWADIAKDVVYSKIMKLMKKY